MTASLILACVWLVVANVTAMFPSRDKHWRFAYAMIALGVPLLAFVWWQNGIWWTLAVLVAAGSVLRWPVYFLLRWLRRQ